MTPKGWMTLNALLNQYHAGAAGEALAYLPQEDAVQAEEHTVSCAGLTDFVLRPSAFIQSVHYSWLAPIIDAAPAELKPFLINSLDERSAQSIQKLLNSDAKTVDFPEGVQAFFRRYLYENLIKGVDLLPPAFIPETEMTGFISMGKEDLLNLIDFLGLYDLAAQLKGSIDQKLMNRVFSLLTPHKREFLQRLLKSKEQVRVRRPNVADIQHDHKSLNRWLHRGGLLRFSDALRGENESVLWHVTRTLDTGRAELLNSHLSAEVKLDKDAQEETDTKEKAIELIRSVKQYLSL